MEFFKRERSDRNYEETRYTTELQPLGVEVGETDKAQWEELVGDSPRHDDLYDLWKDPEVTNPAIRQRLVMALTAPDRARLPFSSPDEAIGRTLWAPEVVDGQSVRGLRYRLAERPELCGELASGVLSWLHYESGGLSPEGLQAQPNYQRAIHDLLPVVNEEQADRLFGYFQINDSEAYWDIEDSSGYNPLRGLLFDTEVPRKYKEAAVAQWAEIAQAEATGMRQPRAEHEAAMKKMGEILHLWTFFDNQEDVDDQIFTDIIGVMERHTPADTAYVPASRAGHIGQHITDPDLRFRFAWNHLASAAPSWNKFKVESAVDADFAQWVAAEADARQLPDFANRLRKMLPSPETI